MRERIIYECEYCNRKRLMSKARMKEHEEQCWYNPKNKTCITCLHNDFDGVNNICGINGFENKKPIVNCLKWKDEDMDFEDYEDSF